MSAVRNGFRIPDQLLLPWSPRYSISVSHAAHLLDVSTRTILRMIEDGTLKAYKMRPDKRSSSWRVNYDSVVEHVERIHLESGLEKRF